MSRETGSPLRLPSERRAGDPVGPRVALDRQPGAAALGVIPQLAVRAGRIVAQVDIVEETSLGLRRRGIRTRHGRIAEIGEFARVAFAAEGTGDAHREPQCRFGWAPWPFSSITAPVAKRSSR